LIEFVPWLGDISPTFFLTAFSELKEKEKQGGNGVASAEGIMMLFLTGTVDAAGLGVFTLDLAFPGLGRILSPSVTASGYAMISFWQVFVGGSSPPQQIEEEGKTQGEQKTQPQ